MTVVYLHSQETARWFIAVGVVLMLGGAAWILTRVLDDRFWPVGVVAVTVGFVVLALA